MKENVISKIQEWNAKFKEILQLSEDKRLLSEREGVEFEDSTDNIFSTSIFSKSHHSILMGLISDYQTICDKKYNRDYASAREQLTILQNKLNAHGKGAVGRIRQAKDPEKKAHLSSEIAFIDSFLNKVIMAISLIDDCLKPIDEYITDGGYSVVLHEDEEDVLLYANKCIILNKIGLFRDECVDILNQLTSRLKGRDYFCYELLFVLGVINLQYRLYNNAIVVLSQLIDELNAKYQEMDISQKEMFFSAHIMVVTCYEYSGDYNRALGVLLGKESNTEPQILCASIIQMIEHVLNKDNKHISDLLFPVGDRTTQAKVIQTLRKALVDQNIFNNKFADIAYKDNEEYLIVTKKSNDSIKAKIKWLYENYKEAWPGDEKKHKEIIEKVAKKYCVPLGQNKFLHDYLHLLAHCLNEEAVLVIKNTGANILYRNLITISRAIMLLVSKDTYLYEAALSYQSCFATVYAEAGEFNIARNCITELANSEEYASLDVSSKAEIDFFYYLLPRIDAISNNRARDTFLQEDHYNHYCNCCYRTLDFDAISYMSVISFEYKIAELLQQDDLPLISNSFHKFAKDEQNVKDFIMATQIDNTNGHNLWLNNEKTKLKYIYHFLDLYLNYKDENNPDDSRTKREPVLIEAAYKYLILRTSFGKPIESLDIPYIKFSDVYAAIGTMKKLFGFECEAELSTTNSGRSEIETETAALIIDDNPIDVESFSKPYAYFVCDGKTEAKKEDDRTVRYFKSKKEAAREFFLYATFLKIKRDFVNPSRIFIMTPVNNAEPCKFSRIDDKELLTKCFDKDETKGQADFSLLQYQYYENQFGSLMHASNNLSINWIYRLSGVTDRCVWAATVSFNDNYRQETRYTVFYPNDPPLSAILYEKNNCKRQLEKFFSSKPKKFLKPNKEDHPEHYGSRKYCGIVITEEITSPLVKELMPFFPEISWESCINENPNGFVLLWRSDPQQTPNDVWRIAFIKADIQKLLTDNEIKQIKQAVCNQGKDDAIKEQGAEEYQDYSDVTLTKWPDPVDPLIELPFLFICHRGSTDYTVKSELKSFFVKNKIRYWYDRELFLGRDWRKDLVEPVIRSPFCVGAVLLITNDSFFESDSINEELKLLLTKKDAENDGFTIISVVYNCQSEEAFHNLILNSYENTNKQAEKENCLKLLKSSKNVMSLLLNGRNGTTLEKYKEKEHETGKPERGSFIAACEDLKVIKEEKQ